MNHKRMIFVLIGLLRCFMYGMENANQPSNDQVPNNYFLCGEKFLPKKYENDFQLKNFIFC
ncbi:MAG TPA: hypothetical protein VL201_00780, partial [Patescibacteria group bacterium]|nr:hypothetical protein [Patescibacteria group bacterium]